MDLVQTTLVLGGQRSGKSVYAEQLIEKAGKGIYIATAQVFDEEMATRVATHQRRRRDMWTTVEEPLDLVGAISANAAKGVPVLVDCLTLWLTNLMLGDKDVDHEVASLVKMLPDCKSPIVLVSSEVGQGVIPDNKLARQFVDCAGQMNRLVAEASNRVVFVTAGIPTLLKDG